MHIQDSAIAEADDSHGTVESRLDRLRRLGFVVAVDSRDRPVAHGATERVAVDRWKSDRTFARSVGRRIRRRAETGVPICLLVDDTGADVSAAANWRAFCDWVGEIAEPLSPGHGVSLLVHADRLPPDALGHTVKSLPASLPCYVYLDNRQMRQHRCDRDAFHAARTWSALWRANERGRPVLPAYGGYVRSACPLLADEAAAGIVAGTGLNAPAGSAWLPAEFDLSAFVTGGHFDESSAAASLRDGVALLDELFDEMRWPTWRQRRDARENRRLAILLTGAGDLAVAGGGDPAELECLVEIRAVFQRLRRELYRASAELAATAGEVPALSVDLPEAGWLCESRREDWSRRFEAARRQTAQRHRNVLVMSPYSVLPKKGAFGPGFTDLLPLIGFADAWSFSAPPRFEGWNSNNFIYFHRRAKAVIQSSQSVSRIAAGA